MLSENVVTRDERVNAALAHASIVLGVFSRGLLGILLALLLWLTQRGKSPFAARHASQALLYQVLGLAVTVTMWISWGVLFAGSVFVPVVFHPGSPESWMPFTMIPAFATMLVPFAVMFAWFVYGLYAAWQVWHGKDFSYVLIGKYIKG